MVPTTRNLTAPPTPVNSFEKVDLCNCQTSKINHTKSQTWTFIALPCSCLNPIHWNQSSREWRCSWGSADRRCSNYIWVINNFIAYSGVTYIRSFMVYFCHHDFKHVASSPLCSLPIYLAALNSATASAARDDRRQSWMRPIASALKTQKTSSQWGKFWLLS